MWNVLELIKAKKAFMFHYLARIEIKISCKQLVCNNNNNNNFGFMHFSPLFNVFPLGFTSSFQNVPNSTLDLSHMICPTFNSHVHKLKRWILRAFFIATKGPKRCFYWVMPNVPKTLMMDQPMAPLKKEKVMNTPMN